MTQAGAQVTPPATLRDLLIALVSGTNPGYTANLPGSLIEDVSSTDVGAITLCDAARVELVNSLTPVGANLFLLNQLGQQFGVPVNQQTNTSALVQFHGTVAMAGFVIAAGFVVSDGQHQYTVVDGGIIGSDGNSALLFASATTSGSWVVPANSITQLITSLPPGIAVTVTNPQAGTPSIGPQTAEQYRAQVVDAGLATAQGVQTMLKTLLANVPGVNPTLTTVLQVNGGGWEVIVSGGDPYLVAYAIYKGVLDVSTLVGSTMVISGITQANPGVVTTTLNHGYVTGNPVTISSANPSAYNGTYSAVVVLDQKRFQLGNAFSGVGLVSLAWSSSAGGTATGSTGTAHGITPGSTFTIAGAAPTGWNGTFTAAAGTGGTTIIWALTPNPGAATVTGSVQSGTANFSTAALPPYVSGGLCTPNSRNVVVSIKDYPDVYSVPYVQPPQQTVTMTVTWNTTATNFIADTSISQYAAPALVSYVNSLGTGVPMNQFELNAVFQSAVAAILPPQLLTRLVFAVSINGVSTPAQAGTGIIAGDPESYFLAQTAGINIVRG